MLSPSMRAAALVVAGAGLLLPALAWAADPPRGTLSSSSPVLTFTSGPFAASNPSSDPSGENLYGGVCPAGAVCDEFELSVDFADVDPDTLVTVTTSWANSAEDFDDYWLDATGTEVVTSSATGNNPEVMTMKVADLTDASYVIRIIPYLVEDGVTTTEIRLGGPASGGGGGGGTPTPDLCETAGGDAGGRFSPSLVRDLAALAPDAPYGAIVHFARGTPASHANLLGKLNLRIAHDFERTAQAVYAIGPVAGFRDLMKSAEVGQLEAIRSVPLLGGTAVWASRARVAQEAAAGGPYYDAGGRVIDGTGVGVAIIDSGVNTLHPDLSGRTVHNFKVACPVPLYGESFLAFCQFADLGTRASSDTTSGHGTHVAGIAVGDGTASDGGYPVGAAAPNVRGSFTGVAPGASLYAFGSGEADSILLLNAAASFDWIVKNNDSLDPKIRVINNSYGGDSEDANGDPAAYQCNPNDLLTKVAHAAINAGISVVFAAGNDGGSGNDDGTLDPARTSTSCRDSYPGTVCVANYNDGGAGGIARGLDNSSSRGLKGQPKSYPDIAAPGASITAACTEPQPGQAVCATGAETAWAPYYGTISGTSMAAPHVAGAIALLYQARPSLTPAQVEDLIQDTARKVGDAKYYLADPQNAGGTVHHGFGAGLLDIPAALDALNIAHAGLPRAGEEALIIDGDTDGRVAGAADLVSLTMTETPAPVTGIVYRMTVRDAADFGDSTQFAYHLRQNVNGRHFETTVTATPGGLTIPPSGAGNSAVALSAERVGNDIFVTVPYAALGYPGVGAPVHNIAIDSADRSGVQDFAPSPANSIGLMADLRPMYGRVFTVQQAVSAPAPAVAANLCAAPGVTLFIDDQDDDRAVYPTTANGSADVKSLQLAEPADQPGKLVLTMQVTSLESLPPNVLWSVIFYGPPKGTNVTGKWHVEMETDETSTASFGYGRYDPANQNLARGPDTADGDEPVATALEGSRYDAATGTITIVINRSNFGGAGDLLSDIGVSIYQLVGARGTGLLEPLDDAGGDSEHALSATCATGRALPSGSGLLLGGSLGGPALLLLGLGALWRRRWHVTKS